MKLNLKRTEFTDISTIGELSIDGNFFCYVIEDSVRELKDLNNDGDFDDNGEGKIFGYTAIPIGEYEVILSYSNRFKKILPEILNVKGYKGVRIHPGNTSVDTEGCLLVGYTKSKNFVGNSRNAFNDLMIKLKEKKITIKIE